MADQENPHGVKKGTESAVDLVINYLKDRLLTEKLQPGDRLPTELELISELEVSRSSVREAIRTLSAAGYIKVRRGDGTYVARPSTSAFLDPLLFELFTTTRDKESLMELREMLEVFIAKLVIKHATDETMAEIEQVHRDMLRLVEAGDYTIDTSVDHDLRFHYKLAEAANNPFVELIYRYIMQYFLPTIRENHKTEDPYQGYLRVHRELLAALKARDADKAEQAISAGMAWWLRHF